MGMLSAVRVNGRDGADPSQDRADRVWCTWLEALAKDAEAALGAACAYEALDDRERNAVLDVLEIDAKRISVPRVAVFAPLLSVEADVDRRERIRSAMGSDVGPNVFVRARSLMGSTRDGDLVVLAETHMYLGFVRVTVCRLTPDRCVHWVRSDPLSDARDAAVPGCVVDGTVLELVPLRTAVDAIARALVAQRRLNGELPPHLRPLVELFDAAGCDENDCMQG